MLRRRKRPLHAVPVSGTPSSSTRAPRVSGTIAPVMTATGQNINNVSKILDRMTGTWEHARCLLIFNVVCLLALFSCLLMWLSSGKIAFHASVVGLCLGMIQVSLCLGNFSAGLMEHVRVIVPGGILLPATNIYPVGRNRAACLGSSICPRRQSHPDHDVYDIHVELLQLCRR